MAASLRMKPTFSGSWGASITAENVEKVINDTGKAWYVIGVIQLLLIGFLIWMNRTPYPGLFDGIFYITSGYFLIRRKSRALSWVLFVYSLYIGAITILGLFRVIVPQGGTNVILALLVIAIAWRGLKAASVYQRKAGYVTAWKHVLWIWASIILLAVVIFFLMSIFMRIFFPLVAGRLLGEIVITVVTVSVGALLIILTRHFPFHRSAGGSVTAEAITAS